MKSETINEKASLLLKEGKITARVRALQAELQQRSDITKDEAVRELSNIVRNRITNVLTAKGHSVTVKNIENLPDSVVSCIQSIKETKNGIEIKLYDKIAAIDRLSRILGWDAPQQIETTVSYSQLDNMTDEELLRIINGEEEDR